VADRHPDGLPQRHAAGPVRDRDLPARGGATGPDGTLRTADASFHPFGRNCAEGGQQEATGGTVTYTIVTDTLVEGAYDLLFGKSRVQGSFSAPTCMLCAPRPAARTCVK